VDVIDVPPEKADELARRLSASTAAKAMADADDRGVRFTAAEKVAVLVVLSNWIYEFGIDALGGKLADLRTELMRDPRIPPFQ
jgi:hypothetical protein